LFSEKRTEHSKKPERLLEWIEKHWPNLRKLVLFRRGSARPGWLAWGTEAEADPASPSARPSRIEFLPVDEALTLRPGCQTAAASPPRPRPDDDGLDIPNFLRRGHAECNIGTGGRR
jgi:hypothetical protein